MPLYYMNKRITAFWELFVAAAGRIALAEGYEADRATATALWQAETHAYFVSS